MATNRQTKEAQIDEVRGRFEKAVAAVLLDFGGVDVETITDLRARFRKAGVEYRVVKNNLVRKALVGTGLEGNEAFKAHLKGMTAIAWTYEDPSSAAKIVKAFRKEGEEREKLTIKCGLVEGQVFDGKSVEERMATLPGKDEVRAQLLAQLMAPAQKLVMQLGAPGQNMALVLDAYRRKQEGG